MSRAGRGDERTLAPAALPAQARRALDADDLMRIKQVGGVAMAPNGARILYTVAGWEHPAARNDTMLGDRHDRRSHVWMVPFAGAAARQLTFGERGESQPVGRPRGPTHAPFEVLGAVGGQRLNPSVRHGTEPEIPTLLGGEPPAVG